MKRDFRKQTRPGFYLAWKEWQLCNCKASSDTTHILFKGISYDMQQKGQTPKLYLNKVKHMKRTRGETGRLVKNLKTCVGPKKKCWYRTEVGWFFIHLCKNIFTSRTFGRLFPFWGLCDFKIPVMLQRMDNIDNIGCTIFIKVFARTKSFILEPGL